jgi:hypothetical protein
LLPLKFNPVPSAANELDNIAYVVGLESAYPEEGQEVSSLQPSPMEMAKVDPTEDEDEELPKLDGAPTESLKPQDFSKSYGKKTGNPQGDFLSKLYR